MTHAQLPIPSAVVARLADCPHPLLFVTVSGAHLYGFESADSDWDLRGAHTSPLKDVVSLSPGPETFEVMDKASTPEVDIVTHDVRKYFRMLAKNNGYVLEQVFSPLVVFAAPEFEEVKHAARLCICKQHRHHFFHFGADQWRAVSATKTPTVKGLLYTYRPLLAGIHLMRSGEVESNLRRLNTDFRLTEIDDLIARKLAGDERMTVDSVELDRHRPVFDRLCGELDRARERSELPDEPGGYAELNDLLIRIRTKGLAGAA
jgi:predicted nucleotidyltransferase